MQRKSHFTPSKILDWIGVWYKRKLPKKHPTKKGLHEGVTYWIRPLWNFCVDGTSLLSHYVGCLGMYQALWYCLSMSLLAYQRNRNSFIFDLRILTFSRTIATHHTKKGPGPRVYEEKTDGKRLSFMDQGANEWSLSSLRQARWHPWCHYRGLCHDLRLNSNRVLKGFCWKNDRGRRSKNDTPKDIQCRYYRTWKTIGDALIYPKHTAFTINIHHASSEKVPWEKLGTLLVRQMGGFGLKMRVPIEHGNIPLLAILVCQRVFWKNPSATVPFVELQGHLQKRKSPYPKISQKTSMYDHSFCIFYCSHHMRNVYIVLYQ